MYHVALFNVACARGPLDDPVMEGFVSQLEAVNAAADRTPGFVWRLQTDDGDATAIRPYDDDRLLINLAVWESVEELERFVYDGPHGAMVRNGARWFERLGTDPLVLWWVRAGTQPSVEEGMARLERLRRDGPTPDAFTFRRRFPPPRAEAAR